MIKSIKLNPVQRSNWELILKIRNEDGIRQACHDIIQISMDDHIKYMKKIEKDENCHGWLITVDDQHVGYTKILHGEFGFIISEKFWGMGIGTKVYELIFEEVKKLGISSLHDTIKIDQPIPLKMALKVGFKQKENIMKDGKIYAYSLTKDF
jgi:RimJ/RimL family protein N-acetyltransferase